MPGCTGTVTANGNTYKYMEVSYGKQRGISVALQGTAGTYYEFKLSPNPHDLRAYNKKQSKFYEEIATDIVTNWPPTIGRTVTALGSDFTLTSR
jgi:hypothetical protein